MKTNEIVKTHMVLEGLFGITKEANEKDDSSGESSLEPLPKDISDHIKSEWDTENGSVEVVLKMLTNVWNDISEEDRADISQMELDDKLDNINGVIDNDSAKYNKQISDYSREEREKSESKNQLSSPDEEYKDNPWVVELGGKLYTFTYVNSDNKSSPEYSEWTAKYRRWWSLNTEALSKKWWNISSDKAYGKLSDMESDRITDLVINSSEFEDIKYAIEQKEQSLNAAQRREDNRERYLSGNLSPEQEKAIAQNDRYDAKQRQKQADADRTQTQQDRANSLSRQSQGDAAARSRDSQNQSIRDQITVAQQNLIQAQNRGDKEAATMWHDRLQGFQAQLRENDDITRVKTLTSRLLNK